MRKILILLWLCIICIMYSEYIVFYGIRKTIILWHQEVLLNYHRGEVNDSADETDNNDNMINSNKTTTSKSFKYKTKITGKTTINTSRLNAEVVVPLKYLSNVWRSLNLPLNNCKIELDLSW